MKEYQDLAREFIHKSYNGIDEIRAALNLMETRLYRLDRGYASSLKEAAERLEAILSNDMDERKGDPVFDIRTRVDYLQATQQEIYCARRLIGIFEAWILHLQTQNAFSSTDLAESGLSAALAIEASKKLGEQAEEQLVEEISFFLRQGHKVDAIQEFITPARFGQGHQFSKGNDR